MTKSDGSVKVAFDYDGSNRRIEKRVYSWDGSQWITSAGQTTRFAYDGSSLIGEFDGNGTLLRSYVWGMTGLLSVTDHTEGGPTTYDVISDTTGSVVALRDAAGNVAASYRYDAWGSLINADGPATDVCNIRFALGYADAETGLQYHLNRYYSTTQHRWISRDPIAEAGGVNTYSYCGNDPVNLRDPSGLAPATQPSTQPASQWYTLNFDDRSSNSLVRYMPIVGGGQLQVESYGRVLQKGIDTTAPAYEICGLIHRIHAVAYETDNEGRFTAEADRLFSLHLDWQQAYWSQSRINLDSATLPIKVRPGSTIVYWPQIPHDVDATRIFEADQNSVGAPSDWERIIPVWGAGRSLIYNIQMGNWGYAAGDLLLLVPDVIGAIGTSAELIRATAAILATARSAIRDLSVRVVIDNGIAPTMFGNIRIIVQSKLDRIVAEANLVAAKGGEITASQQVVLRQNLPVVMRRDAFQNGILRDEFTRNQGFLISQWEQNTKRAWPAGATPHHIVPLESGGANAWWNLMPTHGSLPNHSLPGIPGPHAKGGALRTTIQRGRTQLRPGEETDLRKP